MKIKEYLNIKSITNPKNMAVISMLIALYVILNFFTTIYITPSFKLVSLSYLATAVISILYGPIAALASGFICDILGYIVKPVGPFFIGYAISLMASNLIYSTFLYKRHFSMWSVIIARLLVIILVFFGLNPIWNVLQYGDSGQFFTYERIIKNIIMFPIDVALITFFGKFALVLEKKEKFNLKSLIMIK